MASAGLDRSQPTRLEMLVESRDGTRAIGSANPELPAPLFSVSARTDSFTGKVEDLRRYLGTDATEASATLNWENWGDWGNFANWFEFPDN